MRQAAFYSVLPMIVFSVFAEKTRKQLTQTRLRRNNSIV